MVSVPALILVSLVAGLLLQWGLLRLVNRRHLLAEVNARSSHTEPTPTMGGLVIVLLTLAFLFWVGLELGWLAQGVGVALALVAGIGLWDDLKDLDARVRFSVQTVAAGIALWALGFEPGVFAILLLVGLVWLTNLYNFMDGIDGIAAGQTLVFCLGVQLVSGGVPGWSGDLLWVLGGATLSFLAYNWPPARIFMGDVGSGYVGLLIGFLALFLWQENFFSLTASLILLAGFWVDASYTLCVRAATGQQFTQAHRAHLYQRIAQLKGHAWATTLFLLFCAVWLMPLAWLAEHFGDFQAAWLALATLPLVIACWYFRAGLVEPNAGGSK